MSEILNLIHQITANRDGGRLEILAGAIQGGLSFADGKLVDARVGHLTGFRAVNAAVAMRDARFSFDPSFAPLASSSITASERVVLKQFFGIETAPAPPESRTADSSGASTKPDAACQETSRRQPHARAANQRRRAKCKISANPATRSVQSVVTTLPVASTPPRHLCCSDSARATSCNSVSPVRARLCSRMLRRDCRRC